MDEKELTKQQVQFMVNMGVFVFAGTDEEGKNQYTLDLVECFRSDNTFYQVLFDTYGEDFLNRIVAKDIFLHIDEEGFIWYDTEESGNQKND